MLIALPLSICPKTTWVFKVFKKIIEMKNKLVIL